MTNICERYVITITLINSKSIPYYAIELFMFSFALEKSKTVEDMDQISINIIRKEKETSIVAY